MKHKKLRYLLFFSLGSLSLLTAQKIKIDGELRTRGELRSGFRKPLADSLDAAYVNNLRVRLGASYEEKDYKVRITLQDTETYGSNGINKTGNSLGVYEAWAEYFFTPQFSGVLGRQILEYDDKRLFSSGNWSNTPNAHDLLKLKYETNKFKAHVGGGWNNAADVLYESVYDKSYKSLFYTWLYKPIGKFTASAIWVNEGFQKGKDPEEVKTSIFRNTVGANFSLDDHSIPFSFYATGYYQFGYDRADSKLDASLLALKTKYRFSDFISANLGVDYFSGSKSSLAKNKDHTFNKLYGANHSFNGSMEYWSTLPKQGLVDLYGGVSVKANSKLSFDGGFHTFSTAEKMENRNNKDIGSEIDLLADYKVSQSLSLQAGWSTYMKNKGTRILKDQVGVNTRFPQWAYIMITFKPVFLSTKIDK